jgi:KipI family sensor histidine kinase inhibitor
VTAEGTPTIVPFGESALLVSFGQQIDAALNGRVHALTALIQRGRGGDAPWLAEPVAAYASLLVPFDAGRVGRPEVEGWLRRAMASAPAAADQSPLRQVLEIGVRYGGTNGPDLLEVAERLGMSAEAAIGLHESVEYQVFMLGFAPGFAYLGELPAELELPRRDTPRPRVPAGSVAIAGRQTAVYPLETPGGWHLIGHADARLWNPHRQPPSMLAPGDRVRFRAA